MSANPLKEIEGEDDRTRSTDPAKEEIGSCRLHFMHFMELFKNALNIEYLACMGRGLEEINIVKQTASLKHEIMLFIVDRLYQGAIPENENRTNRVGLTS